MSGAAASICSASIWPLTGRTGGSSGGAIPPMARDQAPAAISTTAAVTSVASASRTPITWSWVASTSVTAMCSRITTPAASAAARRAAASLRLSTWWSCAENRTGQLAEMRLAPPRIAAGHPFDRQAQALLKAEPVAQPRRIVGGGRHHQRAFTPQVNGDPARRLQLGGELRPCRLGTPAEHDQGLLARLSLDIRRQHAGRRMAGAGTGHALIEHRDGRAALRQAPGDAEPDHAGADNDDVA